MRWPPAASTAIASASRGTAPRWRKAVGHIATVKAAIWKIKPGKGAWRRGKAWAEANPDALAALLRALYRVGAMVPDAWQPKRTREAAGRYPTISDCPSEWLHAALDRRNFDIGSTDVIDVADFFVPHRQGRELPVEKPRALVLHPDGALGSGRSIPTPTKRSRARPTGPTSTARALKPLGVALPGANAKVEGALKTATPVGSAGASLVLGTGRLLRRRDLRSRHGRRLHQWHATAASTVMTYQCAELLQCTIYCALRLRCCRIVRQLGRA